jgi:hypothetical protein
MNERIKQLADEADGVFIHKLITGAKQYTFLEKDLEKFAELIVRECGVALSPMLRDMVSRGQAYDLIKQHFGVTE